MKADRGGALKRPINRAQRAFDAKQDSHQESADNEATNDGRETSTSEIPEFLNLQEVQVRISCRKLCSFCLALIPAAVPSWAQDNGRNKTEFFKGREVVANEVLVRFHPTTFQSVIQAQAAAEVDESEWVGGTGLLRLHSVRKNVAALVRELSSRPEIEY